LLNISQFLVAHVEEVAYVEGMTKTTKKKQSLNKHKKRKIWMHILNILKISDSKQ